MAQLFFKYGAMNSGKSIEILKVAHNYEEQGKSVILMTSVLDNRDEVGYISSRIGLKRRAEVIDSDTDIFRSVENREYSKVACILVDEAQFLNKKQIIQLTKIVDELNIPVMAFGLKNDFQNELFEGTKYLLLLADKLEEMKTICWFCTKKAIMNMRVVDGKAVFNGDQIAIGGNDMYYPVCRKHYFNPPENI
ncbi:thymidine kinase [Companilactobacillus sp. DQM5]|uniref:thymidine kinase n=1 Tax=Companilactobacillus sp. DQM5 TaxID=3463359 RepID=UPI004059B70C